MACFYPLKAFRAGDGSIRFGREPRDCKEILKLPCGQCVGCRLERSRQWAVRCVHEASLYEKNCFITLTYNDANLPSDGSLHVEHFQKFMKRLRFSYRGHRPVADGTFPIRFFHCGEYGENFGRPHYHALLFNFDFPDRTIWKKSPSGEMLYRSKILEELWPFGYSSVGEATFQSAAYVARYIMKKVTGKAAESHYREGHDTETGELYYRTPEYTTMSRRPGIATGWFEKFKDDVYPRDFVLVNGRRCRPPRFYDKLLERLPAGTFEFGIDDVKFTREKNAQKLFDDNTPDRLRVKEQVQLANLKLLKRTLT